MAEPSPDTVALMVLAKGFRVSQETEEFQLVWPPSAKALAYDTERRLVNHEAWPAVLQTLYSMPSAEAQAVSCVLLTPSSATSVSVAAARDRYNRPMLVVVCATASITWTNEVDDPVSDTVSTLVTISRFVAERLARRFDGSPREVGNELRTEKFEVHLEDCPKAKPSDVKYWRAVIRSAREWRGISGLGSPPLLALGANVLLGTEHEAMRFAGMGGATIDGYFEPVTLKIVPVSPNLTRWHRPWQPKEEVAIAPTPLPTPTAGADSPEPKLQPAPDPTIQNKLDSIDTSLKNIDRSVERLTEKSVTFLDVAIAFIEAGTEFWFGKRGKRYRK